MSPPSSERRATIVYVHLTHPRKVEQRTLKCSAPMAKFMAEERVALSPTLIRAYVVTIQGNVFRYRRKERQRGPSRMTWVRTDPAELEGIKLSEGEEDHGQH